MTAATETKQGGRSPTRAGAPGYFYLPGEDAGEENHGTPLGIKNLYRVGVKPQWRGRVGWARKSVNRHLHRIKRVFKWAVGTEMIPAAVYAPLAVVEGLRVGECGAKESKRVRPAPDVLIEAARSRVSP